ncbi:MAG: sortase [Saccharofermentanales bacterium]
MEGDCGMDEANDRRDSGQENLAPKMRAPQLRRDLDPEPVETPLPAETPDSSSQRVRKPSFVLSVPSRIEEAEVPPSDEVESPKVVAEAELSDVIQEFKRHLVAKSALMPESDEADPPVEVEEDHAETEEAGGEESLDEGGQELESSEDAPVETLEVSDSSESSVIEEVVEEESKKSKWKTFYLSPLVTRILLGLSVLFLLVGIYLFVKPALIHKNQQKAGQDILDLLANQEPGETGDVSITVNVKDVYSAGSFDDGYDVILPPGVTGETTLPTQPSGERPKTVVIKADSIMRIPSIDFESAIAPDVKEATLWVLPGHFPPSVKPGEVGVAAYFGHRMIKRGLHFNRLNEVKVGDRIQVQRQGVTYNFVVDYYKIVVPADVGKYVYEETDQSRILLVTCDPVIGPRSTKKRILVGGYLENMITP